MAADAQQLDAALPLLEGGAAFQMYEESVIQWKKPTAVASYTLRLNKRHTGISLTSVDRKKEDHRYIEIEQMSDIRIKPFTDESEDVLVADEDLPRFLCIAYYQEKMDFVNVFLISLVAEDAETARAWRLGLDSLVSQNAFNSPRYISPNDLLLRQYDSVCAQESADGTVTFKQVADSISKDARDATRAYFQEKGLDAKSKNDTLPLSELTFEVYRELVEGMRVRPELEEAFKEAAPETAEKGYIDAEVLRQFLVRVQRDERLNEILDPEPSLQDCEDWVKRYETDPELVAKNRMGIAAFNRLLSSESNDCLRPSHRKLYQDLTQPLSHYYVSSSHNTYLTGGQLQSKSTPEIYRQVLLSGCRCLELDMWDPSGDGQEPEITHGKTLCTRIKFYKVIQAIADFAFKNSDLPLILSFENHCSPPMMRRMAAYCRQIFGDLLQDRFMDGDGYDHLPNTLPSPEALRGKILIKNKRHKDDLQGTSKSDDLKAMNLIVDGQIVEEDEEEMKQRRERSGEIAKEMSALVNYITPFHFKGFAVARANKNCYQMSSFQEAKATRFLTGNPVDFVDYNKTQLSRIYPNGTRVKSTNYNPQAYWNVGSQLVSLNYQTLNTSPMQLQLGKFEINARCGYLLKPPPMTNDKSFNPFEALQIDEVVSLNVSVKVLSLQGLPKKDMQPIVEVQLYGLPSDTNKKFRTRPSRGRGLSPRWNSDNTVVFEHIILPDIANLRFHVLDNRDQNSVGWAVLPCSSVQPGYRYIQLNTWKGSAVSLFVRLDVNLYVPSEHSDFIDRIQNPTAFSSMSERNLAAMQALVEEGEEGEGKGVVTSSAEGAAPTPVATPGQTPSLAGPETPAPPPTASESAGSGTDAIDVFKDVVVRKLEEIQTSVEDSWDAVKAVKMDESKLEKNMKKIVASHQKNADSITAAFEHHVREVFKALKPKLKHSDDPAAVREEGLQTLLEAEIRMTQAVHDAFIKMLQEKIHPAMTQARELKYKNSRALLQKRQAKFVKQLDSVLASESSKCMSLVKKEAKGDKKMNSAEKKNALKIIQAHNRKLVTESVHFKKTTMRRHESDLKALDDAFRHDDEALALAHATDISHAQEMHARQSNSLSHELELGYGNSSSGVRWDNESAGSYLKHLRGAKTE